MTQVVLSSGRLKGRSILHLGTKPKPEQIGLLTDEEVRDRMLIQAPPLNPKIRMRSR